MGSVERARKLISDTIGFEFGHGDMQPVNDHDMENLAEAIAAALREQPEARGVVDEAMVDAYLAAQAKAVQAVDDKWGGGGKAASYLHPVREACRAGLTAALTAAQQPVQEGGGVCPKCRGTGEVCTGYIDGTPEMFDCTCRAAAPPSAPVGVPQRVVLWSRGVSPHWYFIARKSDRPDIEGAPVYETLDEIVLRGSPEAQQPAQAAPGWKLVPVEPTEAMLDSGCEQHECEQGDPYYRAPPLSEGDARAIYAAMLAAAPTPPGDDAAGGGS